MTDDNKNENRAQEPNPPTEYFARIPYAVFDARENGELTPSMFLAMLWLYKWCDWSTGSVEKMCAERLVWATEGEFEKRTFEEALQNLQKAGWIHSHHKQGSKRPYRVDICNYVALSGAQKNQILNPSDIKTWRSAQTNAPRGRRADSALTYRGDDREVHREVNGSPAATTMRVSSENNTRGSSGDFQDTDPPLKEAQEKLVEAKTAKPAEATTAQADQIVAWLIRDLKDLASRYQPKPIPAVEFRTAKKYFIEESNAITIPYKAACELFENTARPFLHPGNGASALTTPRQFPTIPRIEPIHNNPIDDEVFAALTSAGNTGLSTKELVSMVYGYPPEQSCNGDYAVSHRYYTAESRIKASIKRHRKQHTIIVAGTDSVKKKYVLQTN